MKIGIARYGLSLQDEAASTVGGGFLTSAVFRAVEAQGAQALAVGSTSKGFKYKRYTGNVDVLLLLTGPHNPLYATAFEAYQLLAQHEGPVAYLQWDNALPFHFGALKNLKARANTKLCEADITRNKRWFLLSQNREEDMRAIKSASVGYANASWNHVPCLFELEELKKPRHSISTPTSESLVYFGSDRPGRIKEVTRWFGQAQSPTLQLHGRWSAASLATVQKNRGLNFGFEFLGPVPEQQVVPKLSCSAATMYLADPYYVKTDFIAQRFFENATAGVPTIFSDYLQPSIKRCIKKYGVDDWIVSSVSELNEWLSVVNGYSLKTRTSLVEAQRLMVETFAEQRTDTLELALQEVFKCVS